LEIGFSVELIPGFPRDTDHSHPSGTRFLCATG
jgi:hypothetical protein